MTHRTGLCGESTSAGDYRDLNHFLYIVTQFKGQKVLEITTLISFMIN